MNVAATPLPWIDARLDSGNGEWVGLEPGDPPRLHLRLRPDPLPADAPADAVPFRQWFHVRVHARPGEAVELVLDDAGEATYPDGWRDYRAVVSEDERNWRRTETRYEDGRLWIRYTPRGGTFVCAAFAPYPLARHAALLARAQGHPDVRRVPLGRTVEGRVLEALRVGAEAPAGPPAWIVARQHPGESMAAWCAEGLLDRLLDDADPVARALRARHALWIVPAMNPDGVAAGWLRTNAAGVNLNRAWQNPDPRTAPEVAAVQAAMGETGCGLFLDLHGDEVLPWVFTAGCEGAAGYGGAWQAAQERFRERLLAASPDYQTRHGYPSPPPGRGNPALATTATGGRFRCPAFTLELPFKDNAGAPDPERGWSPERSARFGAALLGPVLGALDEREESP